VLDDAAAALADGPPLYATVAAAVASIPHHLRGDTASAATLLQRALDRLDEVGAPAMQRFVWARAAAVWADRGQIDEAARFLALAEGTEGDEPIGVLEAARAHVARARGLDATVPQRALQALADGAEARDARFALRVFTATAPRGGLG